MIRLPSPAMCVAVCSTVIALGGAGYSATGGYFILGRANTATTASSLSAHINGRTLQLTNPNAGTSAYPLALSSHASRPPMFVNSSVKVSNLNVEKLDDLDSTQFARSQSSIFSLNAGATSAPIVLLANRPILLMGMTFTLNAESVGQAVIVSALGDPKKQVLAWTGQESHNKTTVSASNVSGKSSSPKDHIIFIDQQHEVEVRVHSGNSIHIQNNASAKRMGRITLLW